ncbi:MAG: hybD [Candidatus Aminicenantes bacterium]|nr:hybD [Candidatus Aminicenantes bacterium]MBP1770171.1 hybD [Candidatus Aminicenantes bacterium]
MTEDAIGRTRPRTVVLGLGNILLGDEGVGVRVVEELERGGGLPGVEIVDGGTAGFRLLPYFDAADLVVVVDAAADGAPPGTVTLLTPAFAGAYPPALTPHDLGLKSIMDALALADERPEIVLLTVSVAEADRASLELSPPVAAAVREAAARIRGLLTRPG